LSYYLPHVDQLGGRSPFALVPLADGPEMEETQVLECQQVYIAWGKMNKENRERKLLGSNSVRA